MLMTLSCKSYITLLVKERKLNVKVVTIVSTLVTHIKPQGGSMRENSHISRLEKIRKKRDLFREMA